MTVTRERPKRVTPQAPPLVVEGEVLYPVAEVAQLWRVGKDHIYDLIARRELRSIQIAHGRAKTRIPASALAEYVKRQLDASDNRRDKRAA